MKAALVAILAGFTACCPAARAERFDCSAFRGFQAQFACYDNLSRAPQPKEAQAPATTKPQASTRQRRQRAN